MPRDTLGNVARSRDNNFNLLRFLAACAVLLSHSVAISTGNPAIEPFRGLVGMSLGDMSVDVFFITSGFLVTASLLSRRSVSGFVAARALRIYPALMVAIPLTVVVVALWFTTEPQRSFLVNPETWRFMVKNVMLVRGIVYTLPGTFEHTPFPLAVNGSLWSLPSELAMYGLLVAVWVALLAVRQRPERLFHICVALVCVIGLTFDSLGLEVPRVDRLTWHLIGMFFAGACLQTFRFRIPFDARLFVGLLALLIASAALDAAVFASVYRLTLPYLVLYLAYAPSATLRQFNRLGDYSYGIYIYAFPVQQMLAFALTGIKPTPMFFASLAITLALAVASWHGIEKQALRLKRNEAIAR